MGAAAKPKLVVSDFHLGRGPYRDDGSVNVFACTSSTGGSASR